MPPLRHTEIYTIFTKANGVTELIYSTEIWIKIKFLLETAGPVAVGTRQELSPVLSGKGVLLATGVELEWVLPKGDRMYWISESINRVKFSTEPISYGDDILTAIGSVRDATKSVVSAVLSTAGRIVSKRPEEIYCPPAPQLPPKFGR
jgi:hypothetical protein